MATFSMLFQDRTLGRGAALDQDRRNGFKDSTIYKTFGMPVSVVSLTLDPPPTRGPPGTTT